MYKNEVNTSQSTDRKRMRLIAQILKKSIFYLIILADVNPSINAKRERELEGTKDWLEARMEPPKFKSLTLLTINLNISK